MDDNASDEQPAREDSASRSPSRSTLHTRLKGTAAQRRLIDEAASRLDEEIQPAFRGLVVHLYRCASIYGAEAWHPIPSRAMQDQLEDCPFKTARLWKNSNVIEVRQGGRYSYTKHRCREYRLQLAFAIRLAEAGREGKAGAYKLASGKRCWGRAQLSTDLRDPSGHRWGTDDNRLLDRALRVLSKSEHRIRLGDVETAVDALKEEAGKAVGEEEASVWARYFAAASALEVIRAQITDERNGVATLQNAYEVQLSGRLTFKRGGPQSLPRAVKALAYDLPDVRNYDIASSQTIALRQLAQELQALGADVDVSPLDSYIGRGGKDRVVRDYGLPRELVKRVEHAVKFGALIPHSVAQARALALQSDPDARWDTVDNRVGAVAGYVLGEAASDEEADRILDVLKDVFGAIEEMVRTLAEGLLTAYWDAHKRRGGRGKGWTMRNAAGVTICPFDYEEGHERRSKAMAWYLQGLEAAFVHAITALSEDYEYTVMANEHDGCITQGTIPEEAIRRARTMSGFREAELIEKPFADAEDVRAFCEQHDISTPTTVEDTTCKSDPISSPKDASSAGGQEAETPSWMPMPVAFGSRDGTKAPRTVPSRYGLRTPLSSYSSRRPARMRSDADTEKAASRFSSRSGT